jgi:hypothetical protein
MYWLFCWPDTNWYCTLCFLVSLWFNHYTQCTMLLFHWTSPEAVVCLIKLSVNTWDLICNKMARVCLNIQNVWDLTRLLYFRLGFVYLMWFSIAQVTQCWRVDGQWIMNWKICTYVRFKVLLVVWLETVTLSRRILSWCHLMQYSGISLQTLRTDSRKSLIWHMFQKMCFFFSASVRASYHMG